MTICNLATQCTMKHIIIIILLLLTNVFFICAQVQISTEIKQIMEKIKSGKELTEQEEAKMEKWGNTMEKQIEALEKSSVKASPKAHTSLVNRDPICPKKADLPALAELNREKYLQMAQGLMTAYGTKLGDLPKLKSLLNNTEKPTDGADMGAAFVMAGAGSASVYAIAWSATHNPDDVLTANNLGVVLKDMGEYAKAIQVLKYADKLKPNIGLILCNLGWAYREAGDYTNAEIMFGKALKASPEMTSPYLGLGLIAKCENNNLRAEEYLRKALAQKFSAVGFGAMKQAQETKSDSQNKENQSKPLADEGSAQGLEVPELPVSENKGKLVSQKQPIGDYLSHLDARTQQLTSELLSVLERIKKQQARAFKDPDNAIVFNRDFSKEIMQFNDVTELLFSENSLYGQALKQGNKLLENNSRNLEKQLPAHTQNLEEILRLQDQLGQLIQQHSECGDNKPCQKKVEVEIDKVKYQMAQVVNRDCKMQKGDLDMSLSAGYKNYTLVSNALREAIPDYYAFTNPILENIYVPSLNEFYNLYRELMVINHLKIAAGFALGLPDLVEQYNELECVEPESPQSSVEVPDPELPKKDKKNCPLGENGISGGIGILSFELSCEHVKLSGGEGVLWSVKRDFNKHETTIWGGIGAKGEYGRGNISGEATIGVEITIGQGDTVKDVAFTSSVKAGIGGLAEGEVSGRFALEGGPSVDSSTNLITPSLSDIMGK